MPKRKPPRVSKVGITRTPDERGRLAAVWVRRKIIAQTGCSEQRAAELARAAARGIYGTDHPEFIDLGAVINRAVELHDKPPLLPAA